MNQWQTNFNNYNFIGRLDQADAHIAQTSPDLLNQDYLARLQRLQKAIKTLREFFEGIDPDVMPPNLPGQCDSEVRNLLSQCQSFEQNKNLGHIDNANSHADNLLNYTRIQLTPISFKETVEKSAAGAEEILKKALVLNETYKGQVSGMAGRITELEKVIEQHKINEVELGKTIEQQKLRLDKIISDFQTQFSTTQSQRAESFTKSAEQFVEKFSAQSGDFKTQFEASIKDQKAIFDGHINASQQKTTEYLAHMELRKSEVDKIYGAVGSSSLAGNFKDTADKEHAAANLLRWISLGLMAGMVIVGILTYYMSIQHPEIDWKLFGFRLATVIVIAIPAVYAAQESSKHRERERKNRKLQIELATIDAYLALLPKPKQDEIKGSLTNKFFGTDESPEKGEEVTKHALFDVLKSAVNNLTKGK